MIIYLTWDQAGCKNLEPQVPLLIERASFLLQDSFNSRNRQVAVDCLVQLQLAQGALEGAPLAKSCVMPLLTKAFCSL